MSINRLARCGLALAVWVTMIGLAHGNSALVLQVERSDSYGEFLVDGQGRALYYFLSDNSEEGGQAQSNCLQDCADTWPPFLVPVWPIPPESIGEGVDPQLLAVLDRTGEGQLQLVYNSWPLYYFVNDQSEGDAGGHTLGGAWFLLSPSGEMAHMSTDHLAGEAITPEQASLIEVHGFVSSGDLAGFENVVEITIQNYAFNPLEVSVPVGTTVVWRQRDSDPHNVHLFPGGGNRLTSSASGELLAQGQRWAVTFYASGIYEYICDPHPFMGGQIQVVEEDE